MPQLFGTLPTAAQSWTVLEPIQSVEATDRAIHFQCGQSRLSVTVLAQNLVHVQMSPTGEFLPRRSWAVTIEDSNWAAVPVGIKEMNGAIEINTDKFLLHIHRDPCRIVCFDPAGRAFAEDIEQGMGWSEQVVSGWKKIEAGEHFYGFGERTGLLDKLAEQKTNWTVDSLDYTTLTDEMYQAIPFFLALRPHLCYGILFNTTYWSQFDIGASKPGVLQMLTRSPNLD
jgi:alpha-glucosidase